MDLTNSTASLAAKATMSAQETVPGQKNSSTLLAESITENPARDVFAGSLRSVPFPCRSTDASQPCKSFLTHLVHGNQATNYTVLDIQRDGRNLKVCV